MQRAMEWSVAAAALALLGGFTWNLARTSELEGDMKANKTQVEALRDDIREIKADVKTLLKGHP